MSSFLHLKRWKIYPEPSSLFQNLNRRLRFVTQKTPLYHLALMGKAPQRLTTIPTDPWPGQTHLGRKILEGTFILGQEVTTIQQLWYPHGLSGEALSDLHSFDYLRDLRAIGDNSSRRMARQLILHWIERNQHWRTLAWRPELIGLRLSNWLGLYDFFAASADEGFRSQFFKSLMRQTRHLARTWEYAPTATHKLFALHGLMMALASLNHETQRLPKLIQKLENLIQQQILPDGGHYSRSPYLQLMVLRLLIDLRSLLRQIQQPIPESLQQIISKMAPLVRLFRHSDGHLACFGPYHSGNSNLIDMVLSLADVRGRPPIRADHTGYERCTSKSGMILINTLPSLCKTPGEGLEPGMGLFNFEWSSTKQRIITYGDCVAQTFSGEILSAIADPGQQISTHQTHHSQGIVFEGSYQHLHKNEYFGFEQTLFLNNDSFDFRGETSIRTSQACLIALRFVFHPSLTLHRINTKRIMVQSPHGPRWLLIASGHSDLQLEQLTDESESSILMLLGQVQGNDQMTIRWVFSQME
ncbi:heparinase II/III family protein [Candidatus Paracaedibacter symbiosus]|uniref:heparinase II/III family protein n=1 Tax=Candidatus Paracaedibacter symbiosus TaxID=244582 RepID=UPI00068F5EE7|nr:heparinase II/III family protein [Candidatus Paracaedibacter symbiosus]